VRGKRVFSVISRSELSSTNIGVEEGVSRPLPLLRKEDEEDVDGPGVAWDNEVWNLTKRSRVIVRWIFVVLVVTE
jgi:hypothetical protein